MISANKVLALMGLDFNSSSTGFRYNEDTTDLTDTVRMYPCFLRLIGPS